jgi:hypothetical protein
VVSAIVAGVALGTVISPSLGAASAHEHGLAPRVHFAVVPVRVCRSAYGADFRRGPRIPRTLVVAIPGNLTDDVALYTDPHSLERVLGPRGWDCVGSFGADGSGGLTIFRPGERSPGFFGSGPPEGRGYVSIVAGQTPACVGCFLQEACPYFANARRLYYQLYRGVASKQCRRPRRELVTALAADLRGVDDPPGVSGNHGPYWSLGDVGYQYARGTYETTCTLTAAQHALCYGVLAWFYAQWRRAPRT